MRLIDADALVKSFQESYYLLSSYYDENYEDENEVIESELISFVEAILRTKDAPTIEAEPVRHGKWAHKYYPTVWYGPGEPPEWICSECQDRAYNTHDYCPNCGAKMDLEEK